MIIRVIDFETTGVEPSDSVVEVGWQDIEDGRLSTAAGSAMVNPGRLIPPEASAIHHILDVDVDRAATWHYWNSRLRYHVDIFAAHHADFERQFFDGEPFICTLKAARRVWPEAPGHSNQTLRYWLNLPVDRAMATPPHRA